MEVIAEDDARSAAEGRPNDPVDSQVDGRSKRRRLINLRFLT
jgi:hypothetical protein